MMDNKGKHAQGFFGFLRGRGRLPLLVLVGALGLLLLVIGATGTDKGSAGGEETLNTRAKELGDYQASLEKEIEVLCESVAGISDCTVMVTLSRGYAVTYCKDKDGDPTTVGGGSSQEALFDSLTPPAVAGVGIVCRGGRDAQVQALLIELVSTALGISSARVFVTGK